jgi:hypothetical protein
MHVVVHIGTEKTGSTTIQKFLKINRVALNASGIGHLSCLGKENARALVAYCMSNRRSDTYTRGNGIDETSVRTQWKARLKRKLQAEFASLQHTKQTLVISSEHFHSRLKSVREVQVLFDLLEPYASKVTVLVYLRRQDQVAVSLFSTRCKEQNASMQILPDASPNVDSYYDYFALLQRWSAVFGADAINLQRFEQLGRGEKALVKSFCRASGLPEQLKYRYPERANSRLSGQAQVGLIWFNRTFPVQTGYHRWLKKRLLTCLQVIFDGPQLLPTKSQAQEFYQRYHQANLQVSECYLDGEALFSGDFSSYPVTPDLDFDCEQVRQIVLECCVSTQKSIGVFGLSREGVALFAHRVYYDSMPAIKRLIDNIFAR